MFYQLIFYISKKKVGNTRTTGHIFEKVKKRLIVRQSVRTFTNANIGKHLVNKVMMSLTTKNFKCSCLKFLGKF